MSDSFATPWAVACQGPRSMGFSRQEYWSGLPFLFPRNLPNSGFEPMSPALAGEFFNTEPPGNCLSQYSTVFPIHYKPKPSAGLTVAFRRWGWPTSVYWFNERNHFKKFWLFVSMLEFIHSKDTRYVPILYQTLRL